jgi:dipeptidyl aminopeptidase/acylaminoacyl peptidase
VEVEPAASPDGLKIAYISFQGGTCDIWMMDYDGNNKERLTSNSFFEGGLCWSPDGDYLAYVSNESGNYDIWILQLTGGAPIRFTNDPGDDMYPSWSPDGTLIAFSSDRSGNNDIWIQEVTLTGTKESKKNSGLKAYPNPFSNCLTIDYSLSESTWVLLYVIGTWGIPLRTISDTYQNPGRFTAGWDGKDDRGNTLPDGLYTIRLSTGSQTITKSVINLKSAK